MKRHIKLLTTILSMALFVAFTPNSIASEEKAFLPGEVWLDTAGQPINAHGGGVLFHEGVYFGMAN